MEQEISLFMLMWKPLLIFLINKMSLLEDFQATESEENSPPKEVVPRQTEVFFKPPKTPTPSKS